MTEKEAKDLVNRAMSVILSCNTYEQLNAAVKYAGLVYKIISKEVGMVNFTNFVQLIERSIGFTQCKIKVNSIEDKDE